MISPIRRVGQSDALRLASGRKSVPKGISTWGLTSPYRELGGNRAPCATGGRLQYALFR